MRSYPEQAIPKIETGNPVGAITPPTFEENPAQQCKPAAIALKQFRKAAPRITVKNVQKATREV